MTVWRRRRPQRPGAAARPAALESVRERLRRQGAGERRRQAVRRGAPLAAAGAFALGLAGASPLLRAAMAARPELFGVRRLEVIGLARLEPADLVAAAGLPGPDPAAAPPAEPPSAGALAARLAAHPWIAHARATRVAPDAVAVRVVERVPAAVWERPDGGPLLVDAAGTPFAPAGGGEALPRLRLAGGPEPPPRVPHPQLAEGVRIARAVEAAGFPRPVVELDGPDPHAVPALWLPGLAARVVLGAGPLEPRLVQLARVLAELPAEGRAAGEIDLRFAGQVVLRAPAPAPPAEGGAGAGAGGASDDTGSRSG